jgi:hypothetical protein
LLLDQRLRLDLRRGGEPTDDAELGAVRAQRVHRLRRVSRHDAHAHTGMRSLKRDDDLRQEVRGGNAGRDHRQVTGHSMTEVTDPSGGLHKKSMGAEHVIREEFPDGSQLTAPRLAHD